MIFCFNNSVLTFFNKLFIIISIELVRSIQKSFRSTKRKWSDQPYLYVYSSCRQHTKNTRCNHMAHFTSNIYCANCVFHLLSIVLIAIRFVGKIVDRTRIQTCVISIAHQLFTVSIDAYGIENSLN